MKEIRLVNVDSLLKKQYSPLGCQPVVSVSDINKEPILLSASIICPRCERPTLIGPDYKYCPYCGNNLTEVSK